MAGKKISQKVDVASKRAKKRTHDSIYNIDNIVSSSHKISCNELFPKEANGVQSGAKQILVPDCKFLSTDFYSHCEEEEENNEVENEEQYEEVHRKYEVAESCGHFFKYGQELPLEFKTGLKVTLRLPTDSK